MGKACRPIVHPLRVLQGWRLGPVNRDPQVASSETEEMTCLLGLLSLYRIYSAKSQQWHVCCSSNLIYAVCCFKWLSVCSIYQGAVEQRWQVPLEQSASMLWRFRCLTQSPVYPRSPCQDGVFLDVPNTHLLRGHTSAGNNNVRSGWHFNSIFVLVDWSVVDLTQRENFLGKKLIESSWEIQMGTLGHSTFLVKEGKGRSHA